MSTITVMLAFITVALDITLSNRIYSEAWIYLANMVRNDGLSIEPAPKPPRHNTLPMEDFLHPIDSLKKNYPIWGGPGNINDNYPPVNGSNPRYEPQYEPFFQEELKPQQSSSTVPSAKNLGFHMALSLKVDTAKESCEPIYGKKDDFYDGSTSALCQKILAQKKQRGVYKGYFYVVRDNNDGTYLICMVNRFSELHYLKNLYIYSAVIFFISLIVAFLVSFIASKILLVPIEECIECQRQFVTDSSHELRTPIATVDANLSVLINQYPDNKWLSYIKEENDRMGKLVKDLLFLSKSDRKLSELNLSHAINNAVLPFESLIYEQGKTLDLEIKRGLKTKGDENAIKQVLTILVDNAMKYSFKDGLIRIKAYKEGQHNIIKVYNTGCGIRLENLDKVFNRFFREDLSRTKGGHGLGLAIASTIIKKHGGSISADSDGTNWVEFTIRLR